MANARIWTAGIVAVALAAGTAGLMLRNKGNGAAAARASAEDAKGAVPVKVIHPSKGALQRLCVQPGSVNSFESIQLFAKVPGFLKVQKVDIGDRVSKGSLLAVVDVPDIEALVERNSAAVEKAESQLVQMKTHVEVARANLDAAQAAVTQAEATARSATAWLNYRKIQLDRMEKLVKTNSIEERFYDESKERHDASVESEIAAKAAIVTSQANVVAGKAKIDQAKADVVEAEAAIKVARAELKRRVNLDFATIRAPFAGVVTYRSMNPGDFVRAADGGANIQPLFTVRRTNLFRVVVLVPDRDVEFIRTGETATMEIDSLPNRKFSATISRIATSLDPQTRLMRVELDLPNNKKGEIYDGMYGQVTIVLEKGTDWLSIPSSCVANKTADGKGDVYLVRDGRAEKVSVTLGIDSGLRVAVLTGLSSVDQVILNPSSDLAKQPAVTPTE